MTLDHYAAIITAGAWIDQQIAMYGPGIGLTAGCIAAAWIRSKIRTWRERRRARRDLQHIELYANHPANRTRKEN